MLVVDDDPDSRRILQAVLEYGGAVVSAAATARDALGVLERVRADVIIPVVAMTAARDERDKILDAGFSERLRKPIAIDGLYRVLGRVSGCGRRR